MRRTVALLLGAMLLFVGAGAGIRCEFHGDDDCEVLCF